MQSWTSWLVRISAIFLIVLSLVMALNNLKNERYFAAHRQISTVEPISEYQEITSTKKKLGLEVSKTSTKHAVFYFNTANNQRVGINRGLTPTIQEKLLAGEKVYVEYLLDEPSAARFVGESRPSTAASFSISLILFVLTVSFWKKL